MSNIERHSDRLEFDLVREGTGVGMGLHGSDRMKELIDRNPDWSLVRRLASYHVVDSILYQALERNSYGIPDDVLGYMHRGYVNTAAQNLRQLQELGRVLGLLDSGGVRAIAFKGPVLAHEAYGNLALRPSTDLDLLVPADNYDKATDLLEKDGYQPVFRPAAGRFRRAMHIFLSRQTPFVKDGKHALDVHMNIMPLGYYYPPSFNALYDRSHSATIAGQAIRSFQAEDILQILCYHGVKNQWDRLKYVCDVAAVIRSENLDWDVVLRRADEMHGERVLAAGLFLARSVLHVALPPVATSLVNRANRARELGDWVIKRIPGSMDTGEVGLWERIRLYLGIQDTLVNKVRYCAYSLVRRLE